MSQFDQSYTSLPSHFYALIQPEALTEGKLIHTNKKLMDEMQLILDDDTITKMTQGAAFPKGLSALAQKYTGHQFGYYNPDLGDGRGLCLGQWKSGQHWDLHLKGSGQTPFSRRGDGRAVLRSAIREYLVGEALHGLGIPTTRCLSLFHGSELVQREQLEPRASYIRVAKTHLRFGHFEWLAERGNIDDFKALADYAIQTVYPELAELDETERYPQLLVNICRRTASLIAGWQAAGFCHGVMNTDNMSIAGETFDFGPFAFLDDCQIHYICNHSDVEGRYAYSQQPHIGQWNSEKLADAFSLILSEEQCTDALNAYVLQYNQDYLDKMRAKLGLLDIGWQPELRQQDRAFITETLLLLNQSKQDFHLFFRQLAELELADTASFSKKLPQDTAWKTWLDKYLARIKLQENEEERKTLINRNTPSWVLRNYIAQEIITEAEQYNYKPLMEWMERLQTPFTVDEEIVITTMKKYLLPPQEDEKNIQLSCSS